MQRYLSERKQKTKINQVYSSWEENFLGYPRDLYLVRFYLTFFLVICFLRKMLILQVMLTPTQFMMQVAFSLQESSKKLFQ